MRRVLIIVVLLALSFVLTGCPYESKIPMGEPEAGSLDTRLAGIWFWIDPTSDGVTEFHIMRFNPSEYYAETLEDFEVTGRFRMYIVDAGGEPFLNIEELVEGDEGGSWMLARYSVSEAGELSIRFVGEGAVPESAASDRQALIDFLAGNLGSETLDDPDGPFILYRSMPEGMPEGGDFEQ